jgi:hypothetical protein
MKTKPDKARYEPETLAEKTNGNLRVSLIKDDRCTNPYLIYGVYTQVSANGQKLQSRPLLWWWGSSKEDGVKQLHVFAKEKKK